MSQADSPIPTMGAFQSSVLSSIKRFAAIFLTVALLGALWSTALVRISERQTATTLLTSVGTDLINPLLIAHSSGLGTDLYQQLQQSATAHPNQPVALPFLKVSILGREIAGKNFSDGSRIIYARVAAAYYMGGPGAAFALPPDLQSAVNAYTPFVQPGSAANSSGLPHSPLPQLPAFASVLYTQVGLTPTTMTAAGHAALLNQVWWFWIASIVLALILVISAKGWDRLWSVAWPVFHASWHIALIGILATILTQHVAQAAPYRGVLDSIGSTFLPVFYSAAIVGIIGIVISLIGKRFFPGAEAKPAVDAMPDARERMAAAYAARMSSTYQSTPPLASRGQPYEPPMADSPPGPEPTSSQESSTNA